MRFPLATYLCCFAYSSVLAPSVSFAFPNSVFVESRSVLVGADSVLLGVFVDNEVPIIAMELPLEIRSIDSGAYCRDHLAWRINPDGRILLSDGWALGELTSRYYPTPDSASSCSGPVSRSYSASSTSIDFVSPDGVYFQGVGNGDVNFLDPALHADRDPLVRDSASLQLILGVSSIPGRFEIDTCCVIPSLHLQFIGTSVESIVPAFSKGIVTVVDCGCECQGDPVCDGVHDILDVSATIDRAFKAAPPSVTPVCINESLINSDGPTDVDCMRATDVVDVVRMIGIAIRGDTSSMPSCPPCPN